MRRWLRAVAIAFGLLLSMVGARSVQAADWPGTSLSEGRRAHPLTGKIYDVKNDRFIVPAGYIAALGKADHVLLGETHDNGDHHRLQGWVIRRLGGGARAVVFEYFRADQQSVLDAFVAGLAHSSEPLDEQVEKLFLVTGWPESGWPDKALYQPLMAAVIEGQFGMLAGNPPRRRVVEVARTGLDAISSDARQRLLLDREMGTALDNALLSELEASHCGLMPKSAFGNMAKAQRFRDGFMGAVMTDAVIGGRKPVLVAGNGHVRRDRGVPWYLARMSEAAGKAGAIAAVGHVEVDPARFEARDYVDTGVYDYLVFTPAAMRPDPCEEMRARFKNTPRSQQ